MSFSQTPQETKIGERVEQLRLLMISPDRAGFDALLADELSYGHSDGLVEDKARFIEEFITGRHGFTAISVTEQSIHVSGDVALVRHHLKGDGYDNRVPSKVDLFVLLVFQKRSNLWQLLARQAVKVPKP